MFEIYYIIPRKGDNTSRDDLFEYSLREVTEKYTLKNSLFDNIDDLIKCIVENCIGYSLKVLYGESTSYVKHPFVVKSGDQLVLDSKLTPNIGRVSVYMGTREVLELEVAMGLENFFNSAGIIKNGKHTHHLAAQEQELSKYQDI